MLFQGTPRFFYALQYALLTNADYSVSEQLWWNHPEQTNELLKALEELGCPVDVVMESTSTYGDLRLC